ncbi:MAG: GyrI-like domain-containing protein [Candidatus Aminicenantes bacterium]|nr:MAG: GyrI-like domain-containing protein [Candidatus Aminicenantes bacterium]
MKKAITASFLLLIFISVQPSAKMLGTSYETAGVSIKEISPFVYCCIPHKGPFTEIENVIKMLMSISQNQRIYPAGPLMGIYHNSPDEVKPEELEWEIGFPITPQAVPLEPLEKKQWDFTLVATALHTGPYEKTGETILKILEWMKTNNYIPAGPVLERYLDMSPSSVPPEKLRTEVWIPCKKKQKIAN